MVIDFPPELEEAIAAASRAVPSSQLMNAAASLSQHYRSSLANGAPPTVRGDLAALSYAVIIMPATYAQLYGAMTATANRLPNWHPRSLLDIGSGPGTALWAAQTVWPSLEKATAWEREPGFIKLGQQLAQASAASLIRQAKWQSVTLSRISLPGDSTKYDLIVLGHVLNEMEENLRREVVRYAWERCQGLLLIVEPGTSAAFPQVRALREQLIGLGAQTIAPCTHDLTCPLVDDWCHFPQRLNRPAFQRRAKSGSASWEESKFSYAAMARFSPTETAWGRLIHQPNVQKGLVELTVSSREGQISRPVALRRHKPSYHQFRDYEWGELLAQLPIATTSADEETAEESSL